MSIISGIIGAITGSDAQESAANSAANATQAASKTNADAIMYATDRSIAAQEKANAQQQANFEKLQAQEAPYRGVGEAAVKPFTDLLTKPYDIEASPSAKYAMEMGTRQINNALQSRGLEGNAVQRLGELGAGVAANDYQTRFSNLLNALNVGTAANAGTTSATNSLNTNLGNSANAMGNALMTGATGAAASNTAAAGALSNSLMAGGQAQAGLYSGLGSASANTAALGLKAYQSGMFSSPYASMPTSTASTAEEAAALI